MKIYISADIEGITGATHWDETDKKHSDFEEFRNQMTAEVNAACEAALKSGATEIWVKDAHASGRNLIPSKLTRSVKIIRCVIRRFVDDRIPFTRRFRRKSFSPYDDGKSFNHQDQQHLCF